MCLIDKNINDSVKKLVTENQKHTLITVGSFLGFLVLMGIWAGILGIGVDESDFGIYVLVGLLACTYFMSLSFSGLASKNDKISMLMTPASTATKFWSRVLIVFFGSIVIFCLGYFVKEYSKIITLGINNIGWFDIPNPFMMPGFSIKDCMILITLFMVTESIFLYGAISWPKKSFIKTIGLIAGAQIILSLLVATFIKLGWRIQITGSADSIYWTSIILFLLLTILFTWMSYRRFKNITLA